MSIKMFKLTFLSKCRLFWALLNIIMNIIMWTSSIEYNLMFLLVFGSITYFFTMNFYKDINRINKLKNLK